MALGDPVCSSVLTDVDADSSFSRQYIPNAPIFLVGLKADLRGDAALERKLKERGEAFVTENEAVKVAKDIKAHAYKVRYRCMQHACAYPIPTQTGAGVLREDAEGSPRAV